MAHRSNDEARGRSRADAEATRPGSVERLRAIEAEREQQHEQGPGSVESLKEVERRHAERARRSRD